MDHEEDILSAIRRHVWVGTYDAEEIVIIVGEEFFPPGEADNNWLRARIKQAFRPVLIALLLFRTSVCSHRAVAK